MSEKATIDGKCYAKMLEGGAAVLEAHAQEINDLNVFPIPDGDTGENMLLTIQGGTDIGEADPDLAQSAKKISDAMLLSARGNSGVILSQFFDGITVGFGNAVEADVGALGKAFRAGVEHAYSAVIKPTEGTILTVVREATDYACSVGAKTPQEFLNAFIEEAKASLDRTPELLPVLKKAGVVDSGGAGLIYIIDGMKRALSGEKFDLAEKRGEKVAELDLDAFGVDSVLEFGYCTELLIRLQNAKVNIESFDINVIIEYLEKIGGDSIVAIKNGSMVKLHVHTMTPHNVLCFCQQFGEFLQVKIENMSLQHNNLNEDAPAAPKKPRERKPVGVVAVANGQGIKQAFLDMGADVIVEGGQSMNPSAEDFLHAFDEVCADTVLVFPNNSNILLAAKQAAALYTDSDVRVLESRTIGDGYAALSMLDTDLGDVDAMVDDCNMAMDGVVTAEISRCVRHAEFGDVCVDDGDYIGFVGKEILSAEGDRYASAIGTVDKMAIADHDVCILICGEDSTEDEAMRIDEYIRNKYPRTELYTINGGQSVYSYIIVAE